MIEKRGSVRIDISLLKQYMQDHYNVYASDVVWFDGEEEGKAMRLSISLNKNFIVSIDDQMVYNGPDMIEAMNIFNSNIKELKQIWATVKTTTTKTTTQNKTTLNIKNGSL